MPPIRRTKPTEPIRPKRRVAGRPTRPAEWEEPTATENPATENPATEIDDADPADTPERPSEDEPDETPDADPAAASSAADAGEGPAGRSSLRGATLVAFALGLVAALVGLGLVIASLVGGDDVENAAFVDEAETEQVLTESAAAVQRLVAIDYERLEEYHGSLGEFLAPHLVEELDETWEALSETYAQTQTVVDAQVREVGLTHLDGDQAEVLLVQDVSMTREGTAAGSTSGTYLVGMTRIDGVWKISRIPDLPS